MFIMLEAYPLTMITALLGTLSVILFFVTSSDSASMVADIIASGGNQDPPVGTRLFWGILEGVLAAALLLAGGLVALQTGSITIGLPFCVIIIVMCFSLLRGLRREELGLIPEAHQRHAAGETD
jgi:choline/glycine/proline betaine transport protein